MSDDKVTDLMDAGVLSAKAAENVSLLRSPVGPSVVSVDLDACGGKIFYLLSLRLF